MSEIFLAACDLPDHERAAFVAAQCGGDDALRARVQALLKQDSRTSAALPSEDEERTASRPAASAPSARAAASRSPGHRRLPSSACSAKAAWASSTAPSRRTRAGGWR
ncbi:MAG: hypothetical protein U1E76_16890 [Planctomycetota bacterium]